MPRRGLPAAGNHSQRLNKVWDRRSRSIHRSGMDIGCVVDIQERSGTSRRQGDVARRTHQPIQCPRGDRWHWAEAGASPLSRQLRRIPRSAPAARNHTGTARAQRMGTTQPRVEQPLLPLRRCAQVPGSRPSPEIASVRVAHAAIGVRDCVQEDRGLLEVARTMPPYTADGMPPCATPAAMPFTLTVLPMLLHLDPQ
jgi:hypothetical protein